MVVTCDFGKQARILDMIISNIWARRHNCVFGCGFTMMNLFVCDFVSVHRRMMENKDITM